MGSRLAFLATFPLVASVLLAGCGEGDSAGASTPTVTAAASETEAASATPQGVQAKKRGAKLMLRDSEFGRAVMNAKGRVLYLFDKETTRAPQCYGDCAVAWPPFLTKGKPVAGDGLDPTLVGSTARSDGTRQVTYNGHPLYYYEHDTPGVILCQDVFEFGGNWLIVNRRGNAIR